MKTANMRKEKSQLTKNSTAAENSVDEFIWREGHPSVNCDLPPLKQQHRNLQPHPDLKDTRTRLRSSRTASAGRIARLDEMNYRLHSCAFIP